MSAATIRVLLVDDQDLVRAGFRMILADAAEWAIPTVRVGQIPEWHEPWRLSNTRHAPPKGAHGL